MSKTSEDTPQVRCEDCGWQGPQDALIVKMHALLCPDCRYVVLYPDDGCLTIPVTLEGGSEPDPSAY